MKRNMILWQLIGFLAVSVLGVLLHFLYAWSGSKFTALFSAVNESTWEHMKLTFFPQLIFAIAEYAVIGKNYKPFWCIKLYGTLIGLILIPVLFYTLRGVFGIMPDWVNIAIFLVSVAVAFIYETRQFLKARALCKYSMTAFVVLCLIAVCFFVFTFYTPRLPLFQDPVDGGFGITRFLYTEPSRAA